MTDDLAKLLDQYFELMPPMIIRLSGKHGDKDYIGGPSLPRKPIPVGQYLVHNQVRPARPLGLHGFRAWTQTHRDNLVVCKCDFGGCKNAELHKKHYRVKPKGQSK